MSTRSDPTGYAARRRELLARSGPGPGRRRGLAALTDAWLRDLWTTAGGEGTGAALVAVGGYGRGELWPGSDLDLVILHHDRDGSRVAALADAVWYPVWDSGVALDHAVRTFDASRRLASSDLAVLLGLLDARAVAGDVALAQRLRSAVLADWRAAARRRLPELRESWEERGARAGDLRHDLEPDLKDGRGGLRDLVTLRAVAAAWLADHPHRSVDHAVGVLADVRDALHETTGRGGNVLVQQEQATVAERTGRATADELLRDVAAAAAAAEHAGAATWRRALAESGRGRWVRRGRAPVLRLLGPGLAEHDGEAVLTGRADPSADPMLLLRFAARAARAGLPLAPASVDRLAAAATPLPRPWPDQARTLFVDLLGAGPGLVPVWEALDQAGLVARLLPEWECVRHRPQRNPVHRFRVDRHLLETAVQAALLVREVARPDLLLLAALLHDLGKGVCADGADHSVTGVPVARAVAERLGLAAPDVRTIGLLVRHHLLLAETATRRDLHDPATAPAVAAAVGDEGALDLLHALTRADAAATGPAAWSDWKAGLVAELVARTRGVLTSAPPPVAPAPELSRASRTLVRAGRPVVRAAAEPSGCWRVTVAAPDRTGLFAAIAGVLALHRLPVRSARIGTVDGLAVDEWTVEPEPGYEPRPEALRLDLGRALAGDLDLAARLAARETGRRCSPAPPRVWIVPGASATATVVEVRAGDRPGLLHRLGTALAGAGVEVTAARVDTWGAEAVDVFYLCDASGRPLGEAASAEVTRLLAGAARCR